MKLSVYKRLVLSAKATKIDQFFAPIYETGFVGFRSVPLTPFESISDSIFGPYKVGSKCQSGETHTPSPIHLGPVVLAVIPCTRSSDRLAIQSSRDFMSLKIRNKIDKQFEKDSNDTIKLINNYRHVFMNFHCWPLVGKCWK